MKSTWLPTLVSRPSELPIGASSPAGNGLSSVPSGTSLSAADWLNCVVRGNYGAFAVNNGATAVIDGCDVRCSFNGIGFSGGARIDVLNSCFWSHPNHGFAIAAPGAIVTFINNIWAVGQNCINAGGNWSGAAESANPFNTSSARPVLSDWNLR